MALSVEIGGPSVIAESFNSNANQTYDSMNMAAANNAPSSAPVTPSQLMNGRLIPASATNARRIGLG